MFPPSGFYRVLALFLPRQWQVREPWGPDRSAGYNNIISRKIAMRVGDGWRDTFQLASGHKRGRVGMLVVETIAKIRRAFFPQKKAIKTISRELKVSRKAIRKAIRSEATEFRYERSVQPMPKIGPWRDRLDELLLANERKPRRSG